MSQWLDSHPEVLEWVAEDLGSKKLKATGRHGMSVESVLRAGIIKQSWQVSYHAGRGGPMLDGVCNWGVKFVIK